MILSVEFSRDRIARLRASSPVCPLRIYRDMTDRAESACEGDIVNFNSLWKARDLVYCTTWLEGGKEEREGGDGRSVRE